jgi:hypothetical protein
VTGPGWPSDRLVTLTCAVFVLCFPRVSCYQTPSVGHVLLKGGGEYVNRRIVTICVLRSLGLVSVNVVYLLYAKGHVFLVVSAFDLAVCACMLVG